MHFFYGGKTDFGIVGRIGKLFGGGAIENFISGM